MRPIEGRSSGIICMFRHYPLHMKGSPHVAQAGLSKKTQPKKGSGRGYCWILMGGHICVDICQGGLAAALPFLVLQSGYSYAEVTTLIFASNIASGIIQPLFGWLGDRKACPWFMALGVLLAGCGMASIGTAQHYWVLVLSAMVTGIGVAMLHPEGGRLANLVSKDRKAAGISIFSFGGHMGFCIGPIITATAITFLGMEGLLVYLIPTIPYAILLLCLNGRFASFGLVDAATIEDADAKDRWGRFGLVLSALSMRSIVHYASTSFIPLFMVGVFGQTEQFGSSMITVFALMGAFSTLISSKVSERVGTTRLLVICFGVLILAFALFALGINVPITIILILVIALASNLFNPPAIAYAQGFLPHHLGTASGLSFGVAVCIGGVVSPLLGKVGDIVGLIPVMWILAGFSAIGLLLAIIVRIKDRQDG